MQHFGILKGCTTETLQTQQLFKLCTSTQHVSRVSTATYTYQCIFNKTTLFSLSRYGFHKINKSPRGHRTSTENQIWEFSHTKFLRNRMDLLGDIKRKAMESDTKQQGDIQAHLNIMQMSQSDMIQQINHLYAQLDRVMKELAESKKKQLSHTTIIKQLAHYISQKNGGKQLNMIFTSLLIVLIKVDC